MKSFVIYYDMEGQPMEGPRHWAPEDIRVAEDYIQGLRVSTVFLHGIDHRIGVRDRTGPPILYETMVFAHVLPDYWDDRKISSRAHRWIKAIYRVLFFWRRHVWQTWDHAQWRYCTKQQAIAGHAEVVRAIRKKRAPSTVAEGLPNVFA